MLCFSSLDFGFRGWLDGLVGFGGIAVVSQSAFGWLVS